MISVSFLLNAQSSRVSGKIVGKLVDQKTAEPLIGANIIIENTFWGAATDIDGYYQILNVPAGTYIVEFSYSGYTTKRLTEVKVLPDYTVTLDVGLKEEILEGETIVVIAERPVVQRDVTSSLKEISTKEIYHSTAATFQQLVANELGSIETGRGRNSGGIHIRGGRNNEITYFVDGVNSNDPFVGNAGINIDNNAIEQMNIISGGFNAEYGESMSGIVQIVTKSGSVEKYSFEAEVETDAPFGGSDLDFGYTKYFGSINGPLEFLGNKKASFYASGHYRDTNDRNPAILPQRHNDSQRLNATMKLKYEPIPAVLRFQITGNYTENKSHFYSHIRSANPYWEDQTFGNKDGDSRISLTISHNLSPTTWYDITFSRFKTYTEYSAQNGADYTEFKAVGYKLEWVQWAEDNDNYNRETGEFLNGWTEEEAWYQYFHDLGYVNKDANGNYEFANQVYEEIARDARVYDTGDWYIGDDGNVYYRPFDLEGYAKYLETQRKNPDDHTYDDYEYAGDIDLFVWPRPRDPLGNFALNFSARWHERSTEYYEGEFSLSSQLNKNNLLKVGGFARTYKLDYTDIQFSNPKPYFDTFEKKPLKFAAFVQDKFEYEDMTINAGIRYDYFDPDSDHPVDLQNLDAGAKKADPKDQLSPRFGISFAVSSETKMYAHYGRFFQDIDLSEFYQNLNADITNGLPLVGNPDLPPEKQTAYEIGIQTELARDVSFDVSAFYKDVTNLLSTDEVKTLYDGSVAEYTIYYLNDFSKIKGLEFELKKRQGPGLSGTLAYSFLNARGTGSDARDFYYQYLGEDSQLPRKEYPLEFDITHDLKAKLNYYFIKDSGPDIFGFKPLSDLNLYMYATFSSGAPYTPEDDRNNPLEIGSGQMPGQKRVDFRLDKYFHPWKNIELDFFVDIRNVFNFENIVEVWPRTGKPDDNDIPPIWDPANLGDYADYERWGYASPEAMYETDVESWRRYSKDPSHYGIPRIVRVGVNLRF
jgi:outer membrane receptor protein involved in Fe transport